MSGRCNIGNRCIKTAMNITERVEPRTMIEGGEIVSVKGSACAVDEGLQTTTESFNDVLKDWTALAVVAYKLAKRDGIGSITDERLLVDL